MDTSHNTDTNIVFYKGYDSIYDTINESNWKTKNEGYDYENSLFEDNCSKYLQRNPTIRNFFPFLKNTCRSPASPFSSQQARIQFKQ